MQRITALKKLSKLLGKSFGYRVNAQAPSREEREAAQQALPALNEARRLTDKAMEERRAFLLANDPVYQALKADYKVAREAADKARSTTTRFKITVGTTTSMFFCVRAEGDTWEEVIEQLERKK